jgi:DNA polymerase-3 subunit beta
MTSITAKDKVTIGFDIDVKRKKLLFRSLLSVINSSTVLPILEDVLIKRENGVISFSATDLENVVSFSEEDSGVPFSVCVGAKSVYRIIQNSMSECVAIRVQDKSKLSLQSGGFKLRLLADPVDQYPRFPVQEDVAKTLKLNVKGFIPYIEKALRFCSNDDLRPAMTGVCITDYKDQLHVVATDAHRLYWQPLCKTPKEFKACSFIIPQKGARLLVEMFITEIDIQLEFVSYHIWAKTEGKLLISRLIDARYPDFHIVMPEEHPLTFYLKRKELSSLLRICDPFTNQSTHQVRLSVSQDKIELSGGDDDFAIDFEYSIPLYNASIGFESFEFALDARFWLESIRVVVDDNIKITHSMNPHRPIVVDDCVLIMPLMLNV